MNKLEKIFMDMATLLLLALIGLIAYLLPIGKEHLVGMMFGAITFLGVAWGVYMGDRILTREKCEKLLDKCFVLFLPILMIVFAMINGIVCVYATQNTIDNAWGYLFSLLVLNVCNMVFYRMKCNNLEQK